MKAVAYELTAHAQAMLEVRGIELEWMERVLASAERTEDHEFSRALRYAIAPIEEFGGRQLRVVYNWTVSPIRVVTVYFDRGLRNTP